jgi:threonine dehydrogenase-like Zn-dependent dehydrogenase
VIVDEITLVGSRCGRFAPAIDLLRNQQVNVEPLLAAEYPLAAAEEAFRQAAAKNILKVLFRLSPLD